MIIKYKEASPTVLIQKNFSPQYDHKIQRVFSHPANTKYALFQICLKTNKQANGLAKKPLVEGLAGSQTAFVESWLRLSPFWTD